MVLKVLVQHEGLRLDRYLTDAVARADVSRSRLQALVEQGHVLLNGLSCKVSQKVTAGDVIQVDWPAPVVMEVLPEEMVLDILFEDESIVVVNKPAGLCVHPGAGRRSGTLVNGLLAHCRDLSGIGGVLRPGIVHRLDVGTSGALVVAKNDRAHQELARQFAKREVIKKYVAFVLGTPKPTSATLKTFYARHPTQRRRFSSTVVKGKEAITSYETQRSGHGVSELSVLLGTGRTHQIRVHLADHGWPVVGDTTYGGRAWGRILSPPLREHCQGLDHQALHAESLTLKHPLTAKKMRWVAPWPKELLEIRRLMR